MLRVVVPFVVPQAIAFLLVLGAIQALQMRQQEEGVVWGDRVHSTPDELGAWLAARGTTYEAWARQHPSAAAQLERATPPRSHAAGAPRLALPGEETILTAAAAVLLIAAAVTAGAIAARLAAARRRIPAVAGRLVPPAQSAAASMSRRLSAALHSATPAAARTLRLVRHGLDRIHIPGPRHDGAASHSGVAASSLFVHLWYRRRLDVVLWTAGVASSLLLGLLTVRLLG